MSMDLKSRTEQSAGIPVLGVQVQGPCLEFCLENTARGEDDTAIKHVKKSEKTNCFSSILLQSECQHGKLILKGKFVRSYSNSAGLLFSSEDFYFNRKIPHP